MGQDGSIRTHLLSGVQLFAIKQWVGAGSDIVTGVREKAPVPASLCQEEKLWVREAASYRALAWCGVEKRRRQFQAGVGAT